MQTENMSRDEAGRDRINQGSPLILTNAQMSARQVKKFCGLNGEGRELLRSAIERLGLSARAYDKILRVSRTIADLDGSQPIEPRHIAEAIQYRSLDRTKR